MGNICRSPTAEGVFQHLVDNEKLTKYMSIDSAGTYAYHKGSKPDPRAIEAAAKRGYDLTKLRARKVTKSDFENFHYILAMDSENYADLLEECDTKHAIKIKYLLEFIPNRKDMDVPDPYYGGKSGFEIVLDLIEESSKSLLEYIKNTHIA